MLPPSRRSRGIPSSCSELTAACSSARTAAHRSIRKLLVSLRDPSGNTVYAGTWLGVYETVDGGASWHLYGSGLPMVVVSDLYMPTDGSYLRVSTYGRGVWEIRF